MNGLIRRRLRRSTLCLFAFVQLGLILFPSHSIADALRLTTVNWEPFYSENLPDKGFFSSIVREAFKRAGYDINIEFQPWKRALETTKKGNYDGLLGVYYSKARTEFLIYSEPVIDTRDVFVAKDKQLVDYQDLNELKSLHVAAVRGSVYAEQLSETGFNVVETNDDLQALRMLLRERVSLVLTGERHFMHLLDIEPDLEMFKEQFVVLAKPYSTSPLYVSILKSKENSQKIVELFNNALADMKQDGSIKSIVKEAGF